MLFLLNVSTSSVWSVCEHATRPGNENALNVMLRLVPMTSIDCFYHSQQNKTFRLYIVWLHLVSMLGICCNLSDVYISFHFILKENVQALWKVCKNSKQKYNSCSLLFIRCPLILSILNRIPTSGVIAKKVVMYTSCC